MYTNSCLLLLQKAKEAESYFERQEYTKYLGAREEILTLAQSLREDGSLVAESLRLGGVAHGWCGDYAKYLEFELCTLAEYERRDGGKLLDKPETARCLKEIGAAHNFLGQHGPELEYKRRALLMYERLGVGECAELANCLQQLGVAYYWSGEYARELETKLRALHIYERVRGGRDSAETAECMRTVATAYQNNGDMLSANKF